MEGVLYGYVRVSTDKQDEQRQIQDILDYCKRNNLDSPKIVREVASGAKERPELDLLLNKLGKGDMVIVTEFSRLTRRGIPDLLKIARQVVDKGAKLKELASTLEYDNSAMGELLMAFTATMDRMERERIAERTRSALRERKAKGVKLGRPKGKSRLDEKRAEIVKYLQKGINKSVIAKLVGCSRSALINWMTVHKNDLKDELNGLKAKKK